jgi:hypothetical protein
MRRIKVTDKLNKTVKDFLDTWVIDWRTQTLNRLNTFLDNTSLFYKKRREYINNIINNIDKLPYLKPVEFQPMIDSFERIITKDNLKKNFKDQIVDVLGFKDLRSNRNYLKVVQDLDIKACPYCNANLTLVVDIETYKRNWKGHKKGEVRERSAKFDIDHYYPTSLYPYLSISFYNLIPSCTNCNRSKSNNPANFYLFHEGNDLDVFSLSIEENSITKYWQTKDRNDLKIIINCFSDAISENHQELFKIKEIYDSQLDVAEELLHIKDAYDKCSKENLINEFRDLFNDPKMIDQLLIRNYTNPEDIHKRPLAKFTQDIGRQLRII